MHSACHIAEYGRKRVSSLTFSEGVRWIDNVAAFRNVWSAALAS